MALEPRTSGPDPHAERRLTAEHVAARALVESATFGEAASRILEAICEALDWQYGTFWRIDREADLLRCVDTWCAPASPFPEFDAVSRRLTFRRGEGLPGRVWSQAQPVWIPDVSRDTNFPRASIAAREGLHGAFGFPILLRGHVQGVMEFFSRDIRAPDADLLSMLTSVGNQIGLFVDRRRAQEELDRFFTLSIDMLCIAGFDGYFKRINPAWERILGYRQTDLLTQPYMDFVHPDDKAATLEQAGRLVEGESILSFENRYMHKDGTFRWLMWTCAPFRQHQVIYASARDITERKAAEETLASYARDLEASQRSLEDQASRLAQLVKELEVAKLRAEEATEAKSAFLANMTHEIRTPLNAILGMTALTLQSKLTAEQRDYLDTVKASADSLLAIVNDILDFSKIEARRLELEHTALDLRETVGDTAKLLALRASEKGLELACHIAPDAPDVVLGDPGRLRQVLLNVLGNAVKFTDKGEVVLDVVVQTIGSSRTTLRFSVSDTGIGIPADKQQQIFQAFTQADSSTTRRFGGTGLGLAIALRLVDLMGGRLWVDSEVGRGSTFSFTADFELPPSTGEKADVERPAALDGLRVLAVDDNATNRKILEEMLASWHMAPTVVADAQLAGAALRDADQSGSRFDVIILDGQMPGVDGYMLARRIKSDRRFAKTPIVMLTSIGGSDKADRRRRVDVDAYLTKPVKHSDLLDALASIVGISTRQSQAMPAPAPAPAARPSRVLQILVAEDNPVNRKLVTTLLQKRGHRVKAVANGRLACDYVAAASGQTCDVLLMDLQMPEMGGFEATQEIRARERDSSRHLPIVALTAHAMQGDRQRCLDAGMDGYLSKPIDVNELIATVERFGGAATTVAVPTGTAADDGLLFDERAALTYAGGDRELLGQVIAIFRGDTPAALRRMRKALEKHDAEALGHAAHAMKGAIATVGSSAGRAAAAELEQMARANRLDAAQGTLTRLEHLLAQLDGEFIAAGFVSPVKTPARRQPKRRPAASTRRRRRSRS
jgi:two-component system, sensor histidine kinase and response regulator